MDRSETAVRVVVAGSSGFLGTLLVTALRERGHRVTRLVRRQPGSDEARWDPYAESLRSAVDVDLVRDADVVINLAGSPLVGNPRSRTWREELLRSRVSTTRVLAEAIVGSERPPAFLAGNGISYYGDHGDQVLTETSESRGDALLTEVTREWQAVTRPAAEAGSRVVVLRTAPVLDRRSPPLKQLRLLFKAGLGGRVGNGRQYFPIISARDWTDAVVYAAEHPTLAGPVNLCIPEPCTNAEFAKALARRVHRPAVLPVPAPAIRAAAGPMAAELLGSLRTEPRALLSAGFTFADSDVRSVVASALGEA